MLQELFTEKYRPKTFDDLILPDRLINSFRKGLTTNLLLSSSAGRGKCVVADTFVTILDEDFEETLSIEEIIDERNDYVVSVENYPIPRFNKFTKCFNLKSGLRIKTDRGYSVIEKLYETIPYSVYNVELDNGLYLKCADEHIVFDDYLQEHKVESLKIGQYVKTVKGASPVVDVVETGDYENMYDFQVEDTRHRYYTDGILSHNTTLAHIFTNEFDLPTLYINGSSETSVEIIRGKVVEFASTLDMLGRSDRPKLIIIDEADGLSQQAFNALRATIEQFAETVRFIFTCNYLNKIPDPIKSRCEVINFDFTKEEEVELKKKYVKKIHLVCKNEGMSIEKDALKEFVQKSFPDLRSMITKLQSYKNQGITNITLDDVNKFTSAHKDVFDLIFDNNNPIENYKIVVGQYSAEVTDVMKSLGSDFIEYIISEKPEHVNKIQKIIIKVAEYQYKNNFVIDEVVNLLALIYELQTIILEK